MMSKHVLLRWLEKSREEGSAIIEFALLLPFVAFLMTGTFDFGRALYIQYNLTAAANAGAQYAVYELSPNGNEGWSTLSASSGAGSITQVVQQDANNSSSSLTVTPTECTCPATSNSVCNTAASGQNVCTVGQSGTGTSTTQTSGYQALYVVVQATETYTTIVPYPWIPASFTLTGQSIEQVN